MADDARFWLAILGVAALFTIVCRRDIAAAVKLFFNGDSFDPVEDHHAHLLALARRERVYNDAKEDYELFKQAHADLAGVSLEDADRFRAKEDELRARLDKAAKNYLDAASL